MSRYRGLIIIAFLALLVSALFFQRTAAQKGERSRQSKTRICCTDGAPPSFTIDDVSHNEGNAGITFYAFTVTRTGGAGTTSSVDYQTQDGTATVADNDYQPRPPVNTLVFGPTDSSLVLFVVANGDTTFEPTEAFTVQLSNPVNGTIADADGTGTIVNDEAPSAGNIMIGEFRVRGAAGALDEYVELYNNTNIAVTVGTSDGSTGWTLAALNSAGTGIDVLVTIPNGTVIPARGHFLAANSSVNGYSLSSYASADLTYITDISDDGGVAVFATSNPGNFTLAFRLDAAGFAGLVGPLPDLFREGPGLTSPGAVNGEYAFMRHAETGLPQDTNNNSADFVFVAPDGAAYGGVQSILGAPGSENLTSPIQRNATIKASLIDTALAATVVPNRVRDLTPYTDLLTPSAPNGGAPGSNPYTLGTLLIRRKFTNNTGAPVTRLRFRIVDITSTNAPPGGGGQADLRALTSATENVTTTCCGSVQVLGITLEQPPTQARGGGLNSSLAEGTITVGTPMTNGANVNINFLLGVATGGTYRFFINVEALP